MPSVSSGSLGWFSTTKMAELVFDPSQVSPNAADAYGGSPSDTVAFLVLLRKVVAVDPADGPTAQEVLQHPWLQ